MNINSIFFDLSKIKFKLIQPNDIEKANLFIFRIYVI
mgnify:CR=1 FL=1